MRALLVCVGLLAATEVGLRVTGRGPWRPFADLAQVPRMSAPDPELGWVSLPGDHVWSTATGTVRTHIAADGSRGFPGTGERTVVLLGGSYMFGFGLSDEDVVNSRLVRLRADLRVIDHAVPGYGTHQSALLAERLDLRGATVVYGLVELHEGRNVAATSWLRGLEQGARDQAWVRVPWARWDGERLLSGPPVGYRHWSLSERVALVDAGERAWIGLTDRLLRTKLETTVRLITDLRDRVEAAGGRFLVALLDLPTRHATYASRLAAAGVETLDLQVSGRLPDGHPDASTHAEWAEKLAVVL